MYEVLQDKLAGTVSENVPLAKFTSFNIGGPAKFFFEADSPHLLLAAYDAARSLNLNFLVLGGASNVLLPDQGFDGLVIRDICQEYVVNQDFLSAQSGVKFDHLVDIATDQSLTGLEFAAGIPGTIGGAMYGNAGAFGGAIADVLDSAVIYNYDDGIKIVDKDYFGFAYRGSILKENFELVLAVTLRLNSGQKEKIADNVNNHRQLRREKHPQVKGCAGSVFKNIKEPELVPAGKLLDDAGCRGLKIGDAEVYEKHCNIIVNNGEANSQQVMELSKLMQKKVYDKFGLNLEYEWIIIDDEL